MRKPDDLEYKVLQMIRESGVDGILQSHIWKKIHATSREGSRISLRLQKAGLIERRRELHGGKWTYRLIAKKRAMTIDSVIDIPCAFCAEQNKCEGGGSISPFTCEKLSAWIDQEASNLNESKKT